MAAQTDHKNLYGTATSIPARHRLSNPPGSCAGLLLKFRQNNKAPGEDDLQAEIYKHTANAIVPWLEQIFGSAGDGKYANWRIAILVLFFNTIDERKCNKFSGISLISVAANFHSPSQVVPGTEISEPALLRVASGRVVATLANESSASTRAT